MAADYFIRVCVCVYRIWQSIHVHLCKRLFPLLPHPLQGSGFWTSFYSHFCSGLIRPAVSEVKYSFVPLVNSWSIYWFIYCGTGFWTQGLHLESLHQPFFVKGFFEIGSLKLAQTLILLISAFWVARIQATGAQRW
jgi:hypothetical protein